MGGRTAGEEPLCIAPLLSCCEDDDCNGCNNDGDVKSHFGKMALLEGIAGQSLRMMALEAAFV